MRVRFADFHLDTEARQIRRGTRDIHLSPKAFELLKVLVENRPRALSKQELLDKIWPGVFVSEASLARAVSEIRDAIDEHSRNDGFVQTVHAFGYRFATEGVIDLGESGSHRRWPFMLAHWQGSRVPPERRRSVDRPRGRRRDQAGFA